MEQLIEFNPVALSLVIPALISGSIAIYAFTRRPVMGSRVFAFLMLALCVWSFSYGIELSCLTLGGMLVSTAIEYLAIATAPVLWLILTLMYTGREKLVTRRNVILLFIIPALTIFMVVTNPLHHFYYSSTGVDTSGLFPMLALTRGPWFWVHTTYSYIMLVTITFLLIERLGKQGTLFRHQVIAMLVGMSLPYMMNILYVVFGLMPFGHLDLTPFAFSLTGAIVAWSMFQHGLFDIMPTAYDTILDSIDDIVVVLDRQNRIVEYNKAANKILELSQVNIGQPAAIVWKERADLLALIQSDTVAHIEIVAGKQDSLRYYEAFSNDATDRHKHALMKVISLHDITEKKQAEQALRLSEEKFRLLIENSHDIIYTLTKDGIFTFVSPAWTTLLGHPVDQVAGHSFQQFVHPDDLAACRVFLQAVVEAGQRQEGVEYRVRHIDGSWYWHTSSAVPLRDEAGTIIGLEGIARDVTERKQMQHKLEEMATHDFLTGLPNRALLLDRFTIAAALAHRNKARLAVMSLDLDEFKSINDTLGHGAGDHVLKVIGARLTGIIRASDTLARVGGDEFILVMMETNHREDATAIANKILDSFTEPLFFDGRQLYLSTSIGIAIYPEDAEDLETLIKKSDAALYYSKGQGRNQFKFFGDGDVGIDGDHKIETD
jgi:diguanylate cyclase (GGDEF)-like protein/PAS domain S-box-containing protein